MKILVVGGGGREHAILKSLAGEGRQLFCAPGNAGIANLATCVDIKINDLDGIVKFATEEKIDLALVSQDEPLVLGMVDALQAAGSTDGEAVRNALVDLEVKGLVTGDLKFDENGDAIKNYVAIKTFKDGQIVFSDAYVG